MKITMGVLSGFLLISSGCALRSNNDTATVKVVGGTQIPLSEDPWTLKINFPDDDDRENLCTATFVSHNTMVTAAHCTLQTRVIALPELGGVRSVKVYGYPSRFPALGTIDDPNDVAVVVFPDNTAPAHARLATKEPKKGDAVTLVGYGSCTEFRGPAETLKRCRGTNTIAEIDAETMIVTRESGGVLLSKGDSGGPLFTDGNQIIGVANSGNGVRSRHANLFAPKNLAFLKTVVRDGKAVICGLEGRSCEGQGSDSRASDQALTPVAKAEALAKQLIEKLNLESRDCSFKQDGSVEMVENNTRFVVEIAYGANTSLDKEMRLNVSLNEHANGSSIFSKLKSTGNLATFAGCNF